MGSTPSEKAGSAAAMTETVQDLGISLGIAVLGSISTTVYRQIMLADMPASVSAEASAAVNDNLWAALSVAQQSPSGLLEEAQAAFTTGFNIASTVSALRVLALAALSGFALQHVGKLR